MPTFAQTSEAWNCSSGSAHEIAAAISHTGFSAHGLAPQESEVLPEDRVQLHRRLRERNQAPATANNGSVMYAQKPLFTHATIPSRIHATESHNT